MFILCLTRSASPSLKKWSLDSPIYKGIVFLLSLLLFINIILLFFLSYINYVHYLFETKNCQRLINKCGTMLKAFVFSRSRLIELKLDGLADCKEQWTSIDDIGKVFRHKQTALSEYVQQNWMKDSLFGYQFLNGVNPMVIRRCSVLPENFPVTDQMVFLDGGKSLAEEMQNGNIFLCDYKLLDGLKANEVNGKQQYLMAPLVLLHKTPKKDQLMPIAIQLKQEPSKDNPIFFPTDSEYDWLLAKMFVRSADFQVHQLNSHLLRTHLLAEVFSVSILRNLPMVHPLYKLLVPNTRYTLQINFLARELLISDGTGLANSSITYTSLCVRDDIKERGLESVPHYYYRDDAFQIWDIINRFVQGVLGYYYKDDSDVQRDTELQTWVLEIFEHGFLSRPESGMPQRLNTVAELVKFITMVIFTCSAQHGAVNNGQFDYGSWMPNTPATLQRPPPTTKGTSDLSSLLETLPDVNATVHGMAIMYLLSKPSSDFVPFGHYPEEYFSEIVPRQQMHLFKGELGLLNSKIEARNLGLKIPYTFLDPALMENSVAI
uniref:Arachidonate 15-lipoxygenase B-like n=1 Tax=Gadus morhua TaxID=8049 RepID=A0A8C5A3D6_GADMO